MLVELKNLTRKDLVITLEDLLSDEFDSSELVYLTEEELISAIINAALFYKNEANYIPSSDVFNSYEKRK
ncbi:hypothetical protein EB118_11445 [bacterium]|nr:hypothetical protein [bacterium]